MQASFLPFVTIHTVLIRYAITYIPINATPINEALSVDMVVYE